MKALRTCRFCGISAYTKEQLSKFKTQSQCKFGHENTCKNCHNKYSAEYHREHKPKPVDKQKFREANKVASKKYREKNPIKVDAHTRANHHVATGESCQNCGATKDLVKHHPDYNQPLVVVTLCGDCHRALHSKYHDLSFHHRMPNGALVSCPQGGLTHGYV